MERVHQLIINKLANKDIDNNIFSYIYPWGENLASIVRVIKDYYQCTIQATPGQDVFGRVIIFNLTLVVEWRVINTGKQWQVRIDNSQ